MSTPLCFQNELRLKLKLTSRKEFSARLVVKAAMKTKLFFIRTKLNRKGNISGSSCSANRITRINSQDAFGLVKMDFYM